MQWLVLDLIALAVIAGCVYFASRAGFVRTILGLTSYILAAIISAISSRAAAEWLYQAFIEGFVKGVLTGNLRAAFMRSVTPADFAESMPVWLRSFFANLPPEAFEGMDFSQNIARVVDAFVDDFLRGQIIWVLAAVLFLFIFVLAAFILRQIIGMFGGLVERLPIVGSLDKILGGVVGGAQAIIILLVAVTAFHAINMFSGGVVPWINPDVIGRTFIVRFFYFLTAFR
jgi:uncharacterized membrane protein required for colicin V production